VLGTADQHRLDEQSQELETSLGASVPVLSLAHSEWHEMSESVILSTHS
jgi:hypothetical protein